MPPTIDIDDLGKYVPLGPNDIWHVGGHMKLEPFGIEISAAIDGYSRYVMWVYIGVSGRSAVSVERQYLDCITSLGYQPRTVHAAKGTETTLLESAHYEIRRFEDPTVDQPGDCFRYGRGMDNPRVEGWCSKLSMAVTSLMHEYFDDLMEEGLFMPDCVPEQVALLALYMPIIRQRVQSWTDIWNIHPIRKQKNRPNLVAGKPIINYFDSDICDPPVEDRKCPFDPESEAVQTLQRGIQEWDPNEYLPPSTLLWCRTQLRGIGQELGLPVGSHFDPEDLHIQLIGDTRQPCRAVYEKLRLRALAHWRSGEEPILQVCEKPSVNRGG